MLGASLRLYSASPALHARLRHLGHDEHPAAVDRVGERASEERADERRTELGETHQADVERRLGEQVHLVVDGNEGEFRAHLRYDEAQPQAPEVREPPQRFDIDDRKAPDQAAGLLLHPHAIDHPHRALTGY